MIPKARIEAFSDAIIAIIITIMALELPIPKQNNFEEIKNFILSLFIFFESFIIIGNFWHKHCMLFREAQKINDKISWKNLLFLFVISLFPLFTKWVINDFKNVLPAISYLILFILANMISHSILFSLLDEKIEDDENQEWKRICSFRYITFGLIAIGSLVISYFEPIISNSILIGLPLVTLLGNAWIDKNDKTGEELAILLKEKKHYKSAYSSFHNKK